VSEGRTSEAPATISFDDNAVLPVLFGQHDAHLVRIERQLGVTLQGRGNHMAIKGDEQSVAVAHEVLTRLYREARRRHTLEAGDVDAAIRFALHAAAGEPGETSDDGAGEFVIQTHRKLIRARTPGQVDYLRALQDCELVFALGPAGTGKTYLAVAMAAAMLARGQVDRLILSRPAVEAGEKLGFLPGDLREKVDPYLRPLYDALHDMMPAEQIARRIENGEIEVAPLAFMRGRTLSNAFVILDEAQNTTPMQMKMFLTRFGENARMVVTGDPTQTDLPPSSLSGLGHAGQILRHVAGIRFVQLTAADIVRHKLVTRIVHAYEAHARGAAPDDDLFARLEDGATP
jgi:phosphate starvation-inducible protein PhoH and related proteins